jgi:hypothetical protein
MINANRYLRRRVGLRSSADGQRIHDVKLFEMQGQNHAIDVAPDPEENYEAPRIGAHPCQARGGEARGGQA